MTSMHKKLLLSLAATSALLLGCQPFASADTTPPTVIATFPQNGATTVDPAITEISVTFSESMQDGGWSWTYADVSRFPDMTGDPVYSNNTTVNTLPVQLEPQTTYEVYLNSVNKTHFTDQAGNALEPYRWTFTTGE